MSTTVENDSMSSGGTVQVADLLPATAPTPEPARLVNFFKALLLFWLLPSRYGPHLAAGSLWRAMAAHVVSLVLAALMLSFAWWAVGGGLGAVRFSLEGLRGALAELLLDLARQSATLPQPWVVPLVVFGAIPLVQIVLLLVATAVMPWCAGGDSAWSVWKRSVKNVYWSTTMLVPAAGVAAVVLVFDPEPVENDALADLLGLAMIIVPPILILRPLIVGAGRYVGPADGPAFAPREPRCDACGYTLIKLPIRSNCPECGLAICDSLPGGRRRPTVWQQHELRPRGFLELVRMQWVILRDPSFFLRLPVHSGLAAARHFWWGSYLLMAATLMLVARLVSLGARWGGPLHGFAWAVALIALIMPFVSQLICMFAGCLWAQWRCGCRDYRVSAIVCYYAAPLMWPLILTMTLLAGTWIYAAAGSTGIYAAAGSTWLDHGIIWLKSWQAFLTYGHVALILVGMAGVGWLGFWGRRLAAALAAARYADV